MKWFLLIVLVGGGAGGYWYWKQQQAKAAAPAQVVTGKAEKGNIFQAVASTGRVVSNLDVDIKCKASGVVTMLPFDISQKVTKGDLLMELDPVDENRAVQQATVATTQSAAKLAQATQNLLVAEQNLITARARAEAILKSSEARSKDARDKADRRKKLLDQQLGSPEEASTAETEATQMAADFTAAKIAVDDLKTQDLALEIKRQDIKLAEAQVMADGITLSNAKQRLSDTRVMAPMDGVVAAQAIQKGTIISSGITNVGGGTTIMTLSDLSRIFVLASVDESDIGRIEIDQDVIVTADALPGRKLKGKVVRVAPKGVNVSNVVTFEVKIEITDPKKGMMKQEMTANVQIISAKKDDVLVVPMLAVTRKKGSYTVSVPGADGVAQDRVIKVGLSDGDRWEVTEGLTEGEVVVLRKDESSSKWKADQGRPGGMGMMGGMGGMGGGRGPR